MSDSPYISNDVKDYLRKFELQKLVNSSINQLLRSKPEDPYGFLIGIFQKLASADIIINKIRPYEMVSGEGFPIVKLSCAVNYMNKDIQFTIPEGFGILADDAVQYEADKFAGKGMGKVVTQIVEAFQLIKGYKCSSQQEIDRILQTLITQKGGNWLHCVNTLSYSIPKIQAHILNKSLYQIISGIAQNKSTLNTNPTLIVNCLQGGKAIGSKCKVFKYMIVSKTQCKDYSLAQVILTAVRKSIVGGKGGEAALKFSPDGTFVCPVDTILDNLKIVQQAINIVNAKDQFSIGLSWAADTLYLPDAKKYELENPKTPFDNDQMIDYLIKLCVDKPVISYLQDPLAATQLQAWKKLKTKLTQTQSLKHIKIGSRNQKLIPVTASPFSQQKIKTSLSNLSIAATVDTHPDLSQEQINQANANKFHLDYYQIRMFQIKTLSNVLKTCKILAKTNTKLILQDNLYETYDTSIVDICIGSGSVIALGSINGNKFDKVCKLNRIKQIELLGTHQHK